MNILGTVFSQLLDVLISFTGDWVLAIVLLTLAVKVLLFPVTIKQQKAVLLSKNLGQVQSLLSEKFKNRSDRINSELVKIAAKHRINPLMPLIMILVQAPILFSLYFALVNFGTTAGSILIPWVVNAGNSDSLHILPTAAGLLQGLGALASADRNLLMFIIPALIGLFFLWKAPAALSVYWGISSLLSLAEKKILAMEFFRTRFLKVAPPEEMLKSVG